MKARNGFDLFRAFSAKNTLGCVIQRRRFTSTHRGCPDGAPELAPGYYISRLQRDEKYFGRRDPGVARRALTPGYYIERRWRS